jgi:hypothetical protein
VTTALQLLEAQGLIATSRGRINILDRDGLQEISNVTVLTGRPAYAPLTRSGPPSSPQA